VNAAQRIVFNQKLRHYVNYPAFRNSAPSGGSVSFSE
jgi:hypothetical protein